jgi:glutathione S-transferase
MAGETFSLVDVYYIPLVQRLFTCEFGDVVTKREGVNAWWKRCTERESVRGCLGGEAGGAAV